MTITVTDAAGDSSSAVGAAGSEAETDRSEADLSVADLSTADLSVGERLELVDAQLAALADVDLASLSSGELLEAVDSLERAERRLAGLASRVLVATETDGIWATSGARTFPAWYAARTGQHAGTARRKVRHARRLRDDLPATSNALKAGRISGDHAAVMAREATASPAMLDQLRDADLGEEFLIGHAEVLDAGRFHQLVKAWAVTTDPDAADRAWREESDNEEVALSPALDGYHLRGWLGTANGQLLQQALDARMGAPAAGDERTPMQRRADSLIDLAHLGLDSGVLKPGARIRPHLAVHVPYATLARLIEATAPPVCRNGTPLTTSADSGIDADTRRDADAGSISTGTGTGTGTGRPQSPPDPADVADGAVIPAAVDNTLMAGVEPATLADGTPIGHALLARIACASSIHRVIFGPESEILDSGREERLFTAGQTRAIIARDRHCQYPDCHAPPGQGEIHHSLWWYEHGGATSARLGILTCWHHHDYIHTHNITIERANGEWIFTRADGTRITPIRAG